MAQQERMSFRALVIALVPFLELLASCIGFTFLIRAFSYPLPGMTVSVPSSLAGCLLVSKERFSRHNPFL